VTDAEKLAVIALINAVLTYRAVRDSSVTAMGFDELDSKREARDREMTAATGHLDKAIRDAQTICNSTKAG
jgi:hypothetical protein